MKTKITKDDKKILEANKILVDKNSELYRDILALVDYIDGKVERENIEEVLNYYRHQCIKKGFKYGRE